MARGANIKAHRETSTLERQDVYMFRKTLYSHAIAGVMMTALLATMGCSGTSNTPDNNGEGTSNNTSAANNNTQENNANTEKTYTLAISIENKTTKPECDFEPLTYTFPATADLAITKVADPPRVRVAYSAEGAVEPRDVTKVTLDINPSMAGQTEVPISSDPEVLGNPGDQPDGYAAISIDFANTSGDASAVRLENTAITVDSGSVTLESLAAGDGEMKGTFSGMATCGKLSVDRVEVEIAGTFEMTAN